jgi:TPR repeat protein
MLSAANLEQIDQALPLAEQGCQLGDNRSCGYRWSFAFKLQEFGKAKRYAARACVNRDLLACDFYWKYSVPSSVSLASRKHLRESCDSGDKDLCRALGLFYGSSTDHRRYCTEGFDIACEILDNDERLGLADAACENGAPRTCLWIGDRLVKGFGLPKDERRGLGYLKNSCSAGNANGCTYAGIVELSAMRRETGSADDAAALFVEGCDLGWASACLQAVRLIREETDLPYDGPLTQADAQRLEAKGCQISRGYNAESKDIYWGSREKKWCGGNRTQN